jgi:uncharacterized membrane protein YedE/YeeE
MKETKYINPYLSGVLLGLVLLATFYVSGRGLGASGAFKSVIAASTDAIAPSHTETATFYQEYMPTHPKPMKSWLVYQVFGVILGALISGAIFGRLKVEMQKGPRITNKRRIVFAVLGGILFGFGAQLGRGCTSGSALTGMANLSAAGFLSMITIFGGGYLFAYFFRKNWI